ncbi:hypothetical protein [Allohahella sp. A8]|uniref:hypothetical protein n=1 Tax=Allohahella sp. A8 TaxID=3141461 RepID=UPI000C091521|nr:hypothetical protein [Hahellaceae bacterium]|tara:strand:- start:86440 stop:86979 length:540 start_codon:yes stop_codon:yes gene_type:complete
MKRMYYIAADLERVASVSEDLHANGITDAQFNVVSANEGALDEQHIHGANFIRRLDIIHSMERGLLGGMLLGVVIVLCLQFFTAFGTTMGLGIQAAIVLFFSCAGTWIGGMGGIGTENYKIRPFHDAVAEGKLLLMVDVPRKLEPTIRKLMTKRHRDVRLAGVGSSFNNPFAQTEKLAH